MGDKNVEAMIGSLSPHLAGVITTAPEAERAVKPDDLAKRVRPLVNVPVLDADAVDLAIDMARAEAGRDGAVLIAGSLYLVGEARELLTADF
jgi:dihydrofolate synthase/folylpolyglutamate synthase